jgi:hypothetical protein
MDVSSFDILSFGHQPSRGGRFAPPFVAAGVTGGTKVFATLGAFSAAGAGSTSVAAGKRFFCLQIEN